MTFRGALPPVDFLAVCFVLQHIAVKDSVLKQLKQQMPNHLAMCYRISCR